MNRILIVACALICSVMLGCKEKKQSNIIITRRPVNTVAKTVKKTGDYEQTMKVEWMGKKYTLKTSLKADADLPTVKEGNQKYYDNVITLQILRPDGSVFKEMRFTKAYFESYLDNTMVSKGVLLGVVYVKCVGNVMYFAASVGSPDKLSDEFIPLVVKVTGNGDVTVSKDELLDTGTDAVENEEEGV